MKKRIRNFLAVSILVLSPCILFSQAGPFPPGGDPPCDSTSPLTPVCPIDGGVSILIAAGLALGGKKAYDVSKKAE